MDYNLHKHLVPFKYNNKLIQKAGDARIYKEATILTPGSWADMVTRAYIMYTKEELQKSVNKWEDNILDIDHSHFPLDIIGKVHNPIFKDNSVKADLYIYPITNNAKDIIALIDAGLVNNLSVEIMTKDKWDPVSNLRMATDIKYYGVAITIDPACKGTKIVD